ncbi:MAG: hypothetical protein WC911_02230 [Thermoleophilia bacterium]
MKRSATAIILLVAVITAIATTPLAATGASATSTEAIDNSLSWTIRGFNYPSWWHDEYLGQSSSDSLSRVAATGANWVAIDPTQYMNTVTSNSMAPENGGAGRTASDEAVIKAIDDAHARGLKVLLKPHIDISDGTSRWDIHPANPVRWFANYKLMMVNYATLADAHHVEMISVGTELVTLSGSNYYSYWADVIGGVRSVYHGPVTYSASTTECDYLSFPGLLDYLGLDVYFSLSDNAEPTLEELMTGWTDYHGYYGDGNWLASIEQWQARWNKPVIFTELGYRSVKYVGREPWDWSAAAYDGPNQARAYEAAFRVLGNKPWLAGVFWWDWMPDVNSGGPGNTDYTIINKPAEDTVKYWNALGQAQGPSVGVTVNSTGWGSYADYLARNLRVDYRFENTGGGPAMNVTMTDSRATDGVQTLTTLPLDLGSLDPGNGITAAVTYKVSAGVASFRAFIDISFRDAYGNSHHLPEALPI